MDLGVDVRQIYVVLVLVRMNAKKKVGTIVRRLRFGMRLLRSFCLVAIFISGSATSLSAQPVDQADIREWQQKDDASDCDGIGWEASGVLTGSPTNEDFLHHGSCIGTVMYVAMCGTFDGDGMFFTPSSSENWIGCVIMAANVGAREVTVSPFDFSIIDANGRKYDQDFTAQASLDPSAMFPTENLRQEQSVMGIIAFSVPSTAKLPYTLEIDPMLNFSLTSPDPGVIVIPKLKSLESVLAGS